MSEKKKLGLIQIFRGLAALFVVGFHLNGSSLDYFNSSFLGGIFITGDLGVDFFFVLSGFIITYVHFNDLINRTNKLNFIKKRIIRIYPIYWVMCSMFLLALIFVGGGKSNHYHQLNFRSVDEYVYIIKNYLLIPHKYTFYLTVAWTLSYEILFYIIFFICILLGFRKAKLLGLIWTILIILKCLFPESKLLPNTLLLNVRILEFLAGCIVAYLVLKGHKISNIIWYPFFISLIVILITYYFSIQHTSLVIVLLALTNGLLVYKLVEIDNHKHRKYPKIFMLLGEASYSIYLSHFLFFAVFLRVLKVIIEKFNVQSSFNLQILLILLFIASVSGGILIYSLIEKPLINFLNKKFITKK